jgi:hypothetical protein
MERKEKHYSIEEVLSKITDREVDFDGDMIKMGSARYKNFKLHGIKCVTCGIEGQYFVKERSNPGPYHFNLYAIKNGSEILMTKDHILSKANGGPDHIDNYRTMCTKCNSKRGNDELKQFHIHRVIEEIVKAKQINFGSIVIEKTGSKWIVTNGNGKVFNKNKELVENRIQQAKEQHDIHYLNNIRFPFMFAIKLVSELNA